MSQSEGMSGPQFRADRVAEQESGPHDDRRREAPRQRANPWCIPRGLEVLLKKAAVDPQFKERLLAGATAAAAEIGLELDDVERLMLKSVPAKQLETIIAQTRVPEEHRRTFLGHAASAMLAVLGLGAAAKAVDVPPPRAPGGVRRGPGPSNVRPKPKTVERRPWRSSPGN